MDVIGKIQMLDVLASSHPKNTSTKSFIASSPVLKVAVLCRVETGANVVDDRHSNPGQDEHDEVDDLQVKHLKPVFFSSSSLAIAERPSKLECLFLKNHSSLAGEDRSLP